jgi:hypothetical protein
MRILVGCLLVFCCAVHGEELPLVTAVEFQPLSAQVTRVLQALDLVGEPMAANDAAELKKLVERSSGGAKEVEAIQRILDKHCLVGVNINPESRVKVQQGPARAELIEQGWRAFLVKVHNEAGVTAVLAVDSPNAGQLANSPAGVVGRRWMDIAMFNKQPLKAHLSGLDLEYRVLQLYSKDPGKREAKLMFDVGQGSQDLGFRNEVDILFTMRPSAKITMRVLDWNDQPTTGSFLIRDEKQRVFPSQTKRLAPDFFFHPQVYRADGESVALPPGTYSIEYSRGPEYRRRFQTLKITDNSPQTITFRLERWIDPARLGWFSGDHHIHAAGCAHYERPTEGVYPQDMMRHVLGEDLKIGSVLTWGPGLVFPEDILRRNRQQSLDCRKQDSLRCRNLRTPVEPHRPPAAAPFEGTGLPGHAQARRLAKLGHADSGLGQEAGRGCRLHALRLGPPDQGGEAAELRNAAL